MTTLTDDDFCKHGLWINSMCADCVMDSVVGDALVYGMGITKIGPEQFVKAEEKSALDVQVGGGHYKGKAFQPVEYILANNLPFVEGNVVKYVTRWRNKGGIDDLKKARHYLDLLIEHEEKSRG